MLSQLYIHIENENENSLKIKHIQYNLFNLLHKLKYISCRRINILLSEIDKGAKIGIDFGDGKIVNVKCRVERLDLMNLAEERTILSIYETIFDFLRILWDKNGWDETDLKNVHETIERENFRTAVSFNKALSSPDKKHKACFNCILFPEYADYYLHFLDKKGQLIKKIQFLHGYQDLAFFITFFPNYNWRDNNYFLLSDLNKEIYFVFNISEDKYTIEYVPKYNSLEECKNHLKAFQAGVSHSEMKKLLNLPI